MSRGGDKTTLPKYPNLDPKGAGESRETLGAEDNELAAVNGLDKGPISVDTARRHCEESAGEVNHVCPGNKPLPSTKPTDVK